MPRNTTGGKNFKKFKTGAEGFRATAARAAADELLDYIIDEERSLAGNLKEHASAAEARKEALRYMKVGRVIKRFGFGRMEVFCHDGVTRQCRIRGLLRKKGQVFIDIDSIVVVSLREAASSSDDETGLGNTKTDANGTADIVGLFNDKQDAQLRKTKIDRRIFPSNDGVGDQEDIFDRSELLEEPKTAEELEEEKRAKRNGGRAAGLAGVGRLVGGAVEGRNTIVEAEGDIDIDDI